MTESIQQIEREALQLLLDGNDATLAQLRQQLSQLVSCRREHTGTGSYLFFQLPIGYPCLHGRPSFAISDVYCELDGSETAASVTLFVEDGLISFLDIASFDDYWPTEIGQFAVHYQNHNGGQRNLDLLRGTPGWPSGGGQTKDGE